MLAVALAVVIVALVRVSGIVRAPTAAPERPASAASSGLRIPEVRGMTASAARIELERGGLRLAGVEAAVGPPGVVLRTLPAVGQSVPPDAAVTLVVGVQATRIAGQPSGESSGSPTAT